jgi:hypothetical protein
LLLRHLLPLILPIEEVGIAGGKYGEIDLVERHGFSSGMWSSLVFLLFPTGDVQRIGHRTVRRRDERVEKESRRGQEME